MNKNTVITYTAGGNSVTFTAARESVLWITDIAGISSNNITISETQGAAQVGSTIESQSIQPRDITINGAVLQAVEDNRSGIIACVLPGIIGRLTITQNGESWYIDGAPKQTPIFSDGLRVQTFQFVLRCPYPYFRSAESGNAQIAGLTKLFQFPCTLAGTWYISQYSESLFAIVENAGTAAMEFDVVFSAITEVTNPEFFHVGRGVFIKINRVMAAGEKITVSTVYGRKGVTLQLADGSSENGFKYLDPESDLN
ncbi:MAG: hypothetical protein ACK5L3_09535, partial [Oscillospiraceae bacterium]